MRNPYDVLGVARDADQEAIRKAYKKLARQYHPDINKTPEAEKRFKEVNAAYDIVGDAEKRKLFDEFGEISTRPGFDADKARAWRSGAGAGGPYPGAGGGFGGGFPGGGFGFDFDMGEGVDMDDVLSSLFGDGARRSRAGRRGRDQHATMDVDPLMAIMGGETTISVPRPDGTVDQLKVRIPPGVGEGGKLKLSGQGLPPPGGGPAGDLHIRLHVPPHPVLRRDGDDLEMDVPITILEAVRGGPVSVPTPHGEIKVNVPPGTQNGQKLRIRGKGVPKATPGDLYLVMRPTVPPSTPETIEAAEKLEAGYAGDVRAGLDLFPTRVS